jgi:hypothetical protein
LNQRNDFFERSHFQQTDHVFLNNIDVFNNYLTNAQKSPTLLDDGHPNRTKSNSVIHHLVATNLGPGKFGTFGSNDSDYFFNSSSNITSSKSVNVPSSTLLDYEKEASSCEKINNTSCQKNIQFLTNRKPRIVAEVKPMRMSYSDVVSKTKCDETNKRIKILDTLTSPSSSPNTTLPVVNKNVKNDKFKHATNNQDRKNDVDKNRKSPIYSNNGANNVEIKKNLLISSTKMERSQQPQQNAKQRMDCFMDLKFRQAIKTLIMKKNIDTLVIQT